jgi:hypothetical protein
MAPLPRAGSGQLLLGDIKQDEEAQLAPLPVHRRCNWKYVWDELW